MFCTTDSGERLIVEMQFLSQDSFRDRMLYYATYPIRSQIMERMRNPEEDGAPRRDKMDYSLNPTYVISILNFELPHESEESLEEGMISRYSICHPKTGKLMTNALHFVYLELERLLWKQNEENKCRNLLEQLAFSLKYGHLLKQRPESFQDEMLRLLYEATAFANMDEKQLENYNAVMRTELDILAWKATARREGLAEGRAEGLAEGRAEGRAEEKTNTARNLLHLGVSHDIIAKATGLTEKEIEALK